MSRTWAEREERMEENADRYGAIRRSGALPAGTWVIIQYGVLLGMGPTRQDAYFVARAVGKLEAGEDRLVTTL